MLLLMLGRFAMARHVAARPVASALSLRGLATKTKVWAVELWHHMDHCPQKPPDYRRPPSAALHHVDNPSGQWDGVRFAAPLKSGKWVLYYNGIVSNMWDEQEKTGWIVAQKPPDYTLRDLYTEAAYHSAFYPPGPGWELGYELKRKLDKSKSLAELAATLREQARTVEAIDPDDYMLMPADHELQWTEGENFTVEPNLKFIEVDADDPLLNRLPPGAALPKAP